MKSPRTPKPRAEGGQSASQRSLFGEILDWMLAPLLFVWPISIAVTHYFANSVAAYPYDQALREHVNAIARQIRFEQGKPTVAVSGSARAMLRSDEVDVVYFHVMSREGRQLVGDKELPPPDDLPFLDIAPGEIHFREAEVAGQDLRVAFTTVADPRKPRDAWLLVEVAETLEKRNQLANKIIASVILPQFVIIPLAVVLVWFGLSQGLRSLTRLRERIASREEADLSPIDTQRVPEEVQPLIDAFNALLQRMQENMEAQTRFIADAAHQLRTPLTALKTQAQLAQGEADPEALRHALGQIATSVDRASHLVNQLLALARAETGKGAQTMEAVDLDHLLRDIAGDWVIQALDRQIDLGFEPSPSPALIRGSAFLLRELTNNLIDNALRYTPSGGRVTARVVPDGNWVELQVEDSGIGITEEQSELVFERFYRVDDAHSQGSGLGLAIVREIAELHGATARLRPLAEMPGREGEKGAIARVRFPAYGEVPGVEVTPLPTLDTSIPTGLG